MRLQGRGSVSVLDPDVALIVPFDEDTLNHTELVTLGLDFFLEVVEEGRGCALHLEHVGHDQVRSSNSGDGWTLQVGVAGCSCALGKLVH